MIHPIRFSLTLLTSLCLSSAAFAAPPNAESDVEILSEKIEEKLSDHKVDIAKSSARLKRKMKRGLDKSSGELSEDIDVVMDVLEDSFAKEGLFRNLAAMFGDFAEDIDIETDDGDMTLSFDGATVAKIQRETSRDSEDSFSISGLGKNLTIDRETIVKGGKRKTRIVIDMDGEDEIDITMPELK